MNASRDWSASLPAFDNQSSPSTHSDAEDCISQSAVHCIEIMEFALTGKRVRYSPRALGKLSGTTPQGNSIQTVFATIQKYGLIPYDLWPDLETFTWADYYTDIPQNVIDAGKDFLSRFNVELKDTADLAKAPVWIGMNLGNTNHFVTQINETQYFDSYQPPVKTINFPIISRHQIIISPKEIMNQAKLVKSKHSPTIYVCYPIPSEGYLREKGSMEGFAVPADLTTVPDTDSLA